MQPLRLDSMASLPSAAERPDATAPVSRARRVVASFGKGFAAFVAGIMIGATAIVLADLIVPGQADGSRFEAGPVQLRR